MRLSHVKTRLATLLSAKKRELFFRRVETPQPFVVQEEKRHYRLHFADGCVTTLPKRLFWYGGRDKERTSRAKLRIGRCTYLQNARIGPFWDDRSVEVGSFCSFGPDVDLRLDGVRGANQFTSYPLELLDPASRVYRGNVEALRSLRIEIGNDCFLGENVKILQNVRIGDGVILGARTLVPAGKVLEPYGVYAGLPARLVRRRFDEAIVEELLRVQWWTWDKARIVASGLQHVDFVRERDRALDLLRAL